MRNVDLIRIESKKYDFLIQEVQSYGVCIDFVIQFLNRLFRRKGPLNLKFADLIALVQSFFCSTFYIGQIPYAKNIKFRNEKATCKILLKLIPYKE
jgi:hypothetical protein